MAGRFSLRALAFLQAMLLLATLLLPALVAAATIQTDLFVYNDGDTVNVTGVEYGANEVVDFVTTDPDGTVVDSGQASSDDQGNVGYSFTLHTTVGGLYTVTGTGEASGYSASAQFDPPKWSLNGAVTPASLTVTQGSLTIGGTLALGTGTCVSPAATVAGQTVSLEINGSPAASTTTGPSGAYSFTYTPLVKGSIQFKLSIAATPACNADSQTFNYVVDGRTTSISVTCSPSSVPLGSPSTCTASVTDTNAGAPTTPTGTVTWSGPNPQSQFSSGTCTLGPAGTCQITYTPSGSTTARSISANHGGDTLHAGSASSAFTLSIGASTVTTSVGSITASASTYGGATNLSAAVSPAGAPGSVAFFVNGSLTPIPATYNSVTGAATVSGYVHGLNASASAYSVRAAFTSSDTTAFTNSQATNGSALLVGQASSTVTVVCTAGAPYTYTGAAQTPCTAKASGVGMTDVNLTGSIVYSNNTNAGSAGASATWAGDTNHTGNSGSSTFTIAKADAVCSVTPYTSATTTYDATEHTATGSCTGVDAGGTAVGGSLDLSSTKHTNAGTYSSDSWSFNGGTNYNNQGPVTITDSIAKADAVCSISGYSGTYNAAAHGATGSCAGVVLDPTAVGSSLNLGASFTNAPGGTAHWTFTGGTNYNNQSGDASIAIAKADAVCSVTGYTVVYDHISHTATGSCTGVDAGGTASGGALTLTGTTHTNPGTYLDSWSFTGGTNYNNQTSSVTDRILFAATGLCNGSASHQILQPINADGTSTFKQGSTVPAKFRVCDAAGNSIGDAGVVVSFKLIGTFNGTVTTTVNEDVVSTTPDTAFRWDPTDKQWIYNINTKNLQKNNSYYYLVTLSDGTGISFNFGLK